MAQPIQMMLQSSPVTEASLSSQPNPTSRESFADHGVSVARMSAQHLCRSTGQLADTLGHPQKASRVSTSASHYLIALIAGAMLVLAFAPFELYPLAVICPAVLLLLSLHASQRHALLLGFLFGFGFFSFGVSWVFISIHIFGQTSIALSLLITAFFVCILASFIALQSYLLVLLFPENDRVKRYVLFPSLWTLSEWLRSWIFTGFPWLLLGTSQVNSPLAGYAPIVGGLGVSFLVTLSSTLLLESLYLLLCKHANRSALKSAGRHFIWPALLLIIIWGSGYLLTSIHWSRVVNRPIRVSLIQANVPQALKWSPAYLNASLDTYNQLTIAHWSSRLIIWPEAAIPLLQHRASTFLHMLDREAKQHGITLITGIPIQEGQRYYNSMIALGIDHALYYKRKLVIFGEFLPWWIRWAHGLLNLLDIPMSDFSPGPAQQVPFTVAGVELGTFICYEIAYPSLILQALPQAQLLLTINDDAWFGDSLALRQHLQIGMFQALVAGRYLIFLSNTGMTAIVTPRGKMLAKLPTFQRDVLSSTVYPCLGRTPWAYVGDTPVIILVLGAIILCYAYRRSIHLS